MVTNDEMIGEMTSAKYAIIISIYEVEASSSGTFFSLYVCPTTNIVTPPKETTRQIFSKSAIFSLRIKYPRTAVTIGTVLVDIELKTRGSYLSELVDRNTPIRPSMTLPDRALIIFLFT